LKSKNLPTFGVAEERIKRLKRFYGIIDDDNDNKPKKKSTVDKIKEIEEKRKLRRENMQNKLIVREEKKQINMERGQLGDVDFYMKIEQFKKKLLTTYKPRNFYENKNKIMVCVRKRPIFEDEKSRGNIDCVSILNPICLIHECKFKVDGITKYLENHQFCFDNTFSENNNSDEIFNSAVKPLIPHYFNGNNATVFAYGQTGSGKTYTMTGLVNSLAD